MDNVVGEIEEAERQVKKYKKALEVRSDPAIVLFVLFACFARLCPCVHIDPD